MSTYIRAGIFEIEHVLSKVFTREMMQSLKKQGHKASSLIWKMLERRNFTGVVEGALKTLSVSMKSQRYQLFAEKGTICVCCGLKAEYFALERHRNGNTDKFHFNLYGRRNGEEIMFTKDHIIPKSKGGPDTIENYQTMCQECNLRKKDDICQARQ
jgi:hypothetical protein